MSTSSRLEHAFKNALELPLSAHTKYVLFNDCQSRFLVRYLWFPLENFGVLDPTSAAKNYPLKEQCEKRLAHWAAAHHKPLVTGHTHRPILSPDSPFYYNTGSCVHPRCITCIEIERCNLTLVKWSMRTRADASLYVAREVLAGPICPFCTLP